MYRRPVVTTEADASRTGNDDTFRAAGIDPANLVVIFCRDIKVAELVKDDVDRMAAGQFRSRKGGDDAIRVYLADVAGHCIGNIEVAGSVEGDAGRFEKAGTRGRPTVAGTLV